MKALFGEAMSAATRLTRQGKLGEATAVIQRALGLTTRSGVTPRRSEPRHRLPMGSPPTVATTTKPVDGSRFVDGSFTYGAVTRAYKLFVPDTLSASPGLVLMLHGCKQDPDDFARGTRMNAHAADADCLVLYPAQARHANVNGCWNWFERDHQHRDRGETGLLGRLVQDLVARHAVRDSRVYVAGLSAGGAMAAVMADAYPELFAAACVHSGLAAGAATNLSEALRAMRSGPVSERSSTGADAIVPTIVFHGAQDRTVDASNADAIVASLIARKGRAAMGAPRVVKTTDAKGRRVTQTIYPDTDGRTVVEDWRAHGSAHAWLGGAADGSYTEPQAIDATREMLRFFGEQGRT